MYTTIFARHVNNVVMDYSLRRHLVLDGAVIDENSVLCSSLTNRKAWCLPVPEFFKQYKVVDLAKDGSMVAELINTDATP